MLARIWARWMVRMPGIAVQAPPMCMRQLLSTAVQYSARVERMSLSLVESIAEETSAFLMEKVPPKPQQRSRFSSGTRSMPAHLAQQAQGPIAEVQRPQSVTACVIGDAMRKICAHVVDAELVDEKFTQLINLGSNACKLLRSSSLPSSSNSAGILIADHGDAGGGRDNDGFCLLIHTDEAARLRKASERKPVLACICPQQVCLA